VLVLCSIATQAGSGVRIQKTDDDDVALADEPMPLYTVAASTYRAEIFRDGCLRLVAGKTELLANLVFALERKEMQLANIRLDGDHALVLREGLCSNEAVLRNTEL